jgi:hypothetical protein
MRSVTYSWRFVELYVSIYNTLLPVNLKFFLGFGIIFVADSDLYVN